MKFSPLVLLALATAANAAPAARDNSGKCRPKSDALPGSSSKPSGTGSPSTAASSATPSSSANSTDCNIPEIGNQSYFLDPNVVVQMPPSRGLDPNVTELVVPEGSLGINPDGGLPPDDPIALILLERINQFRSIYKAPPMFWNQTISGYAVGFGKKCVFEHFMQGDGLFGEVLLDFGPLDKADLAYQAKRWIDGWMIEGKQWDYNNQKPVEGQATGHWEVLTDPWNNQVGCGWAACGKIYCDVGKNFTDIWAHQVPQTKERVWPQTCEKIPWAWYIEPNQPNKVYPDTW
ncbi:hypothetical protein Q8F55_004780 [Vanrija albida]|uniref:SCP domain-containing protein n=1 Tax=Vanrija albida TaxID=181172 RepID=A0ABR3Q020_9TREE